MTRFKFVPAVFILITGLLSAQNKTAGVPFILGHTDILQSVELGEKRILNIHLPEGYYPDSAATYPVIYLLDGGADEDFMHIAALVQFNSFSWVNRVQPSIVVGIANTDRKREMTFKPAADFKLRDFVETYKAEDHGTILHQAVNNAFKLFSAKQK